MRTLFLILLLVLAPIGVSAKSVEDQVTEQLLAQGYDDISMNRTLLGRLRVVALSKTTKRELILNPATGQILRDRSQQLINNDETNVVISQDPGNPQPTSDTDEPASETPTPGQSSEPPEQSDPPDAPQPSGPPEPPRDPKPGGAPNAPPKGGN